VPDDLNYDALEISKHITKSKFILQNPYLKSKVFIQSSDAHFIENLGEVTTTFNLENLVFDEMKMALHNLEGRSVNF
jgi:PHP family Zn ribbon phosphoesterase